MKIKANTRPTGNVIAKCRPHWTSLILPEILCFLLFWGILASVYALFTEDIQIALTMLVTTVGFTALDIWYISARLKTDSLILTDSHIIGKTGIIHTKTMSTPLSKVQAVSVSNGLLGKMFGYHTITIACAATGISEYVFTHMSGAEEFVAMVDNAT